jgi:hypothetical protein
MVMMRMNEMEAGKERQNLLLRTVISHLPSKTNVMALLKVLIRSAGIMTAALQLIDGAMGNISLVESR